MNYAREDPTPQVSFLQQCLSGDKKPIGLFLGAGCPMSVKDENNDPLIPDIAGITDCVYQHLKECKKYRAILETAENHLKKDGNCNPSVEDLLSHVRSLRAVAGSDRVRDLTAHELDTIDHEICSLIHQTVDKELPSDQTPYHRVANWLHAIRRNFPVEFFTTNYDLLLEQALEESRVPYFDGFAGSRNPHFNAREIEENALPPNWARLWKLHGSINWYQNENGDVYRGNANEGKRTRVIHPSHLKYQESRRMPYLAMVDRLRAFLKCPTAAIVLCGYSFRDDHINESIVQGLQYTQTAVAFALLFGEIRNYENATNLAGIRPNLNVLASDGGVIGGRQVEWQESGFDSVSGKPSTAVTWNPTKRTDDQTKYKAQFNLGDFSKLGQFLHELVGSIRYPWEDASNVQ